MGLTTLSLAGLAVIVAACGKGSLAGNLVQQPTFEPKDQTKCKVSKSQYRPLIIEWPGADRADLGTKVSDTANPSLVAVRYVGCEMKVLAGCRVEGKYRFVTTQREQERVVMDDADSLYAEMPLAAAKFEAYFQQRKGLRVNTTIVGKYVADRPSVRLEDLQRAGAECSEATHVVTGITTGAFQFYSEGSAALGAQAGPWVAGKSNAAQETLKQSGEESACKHSKRGDTSPPDDCGALLRLEVEPIKCPEGMAFEDGKGCVTKGRGAPVPETSEAGAKAPDPGRSLDPRDAAYVRASMDILSGLHRLASGRSAAEPQLTCADGPPEVSSSVKARAPLLGPSPDMVLGGTEMRIWTQADGKWLRLEPVILHGRDGKPRWLVKDSDSDSEPSPDAKDVDALPPFLAGVVRHLAESLQPATCNPTLADPSDFAALPLPPEVREKLQRFFKEQGDIHATCRKVGDLKASWKVLLRDHAAFFYGAGKIGVLQGRLRAEGSRACVGRVGLDLIDPKTGREVSAPGGGE